MKRKMTKREIGLFWFWWFMGLVCVGCVLCLKKFMGWGGRWRKGRWGIILVLVLVWVCAHMYCFGLCWACDIEGDWKRKFFLGRDGRASCKGKVEHRKTEYRERKRPKHRVLENCYYVLLFFFFNNVLT